MLVVPVAAGQHASAVSQHTYDASSGNAPLENPKNPEVVQSRDVGNNVMWNIRPSLPVSQRFSIQSGAGDWLIRQPADNLLKSLEVCNKFCLEWSFRKAINFIQYQQSPHGTNTA